MLDCSVSNSIRSSPMTELTTSTRDWGLSITIFKPVVPRKGSLLDFYQFYTTHHLFHHQSSQFTDFFFCCTCFTVTSNNYNRRSQLFTWTSCGDITVSVQTFIVTIIRDIRTCIHIKLMQNIVRLQNILMQSHDCNWRKTAYLNEWSLCCRLVSKNKGSWPVCLFVTWNPSILH